MVSENRCMMCGKDNPPELEECQYCQARLKPLIINQPEQSIDRAEAASPIPTEKQESDPTDWLKDLRPSDIEPKEETASDQEPWFDNVFEQTETDSAKDEQDWLADLRIDSGGLPDLSVDDEASWDNDAEDSGELFDEQIPEDRIPPAHADQASPVTSIESDGQKAGPGLDEDAPEWLQQIRSLHKIEQESSLSEDDSESEEPFDIEWDDHPELVEQIDADGAPDGTSPIPPDDVVPDNGEENLAEATSGLTDSFDDLDLGVVDELPDWLSSESKVPDEGESIDEQELLSADETEDKSTLSGADNHFGELQMTRSRVKRN